MNALVPPDHLHWDDESKSYGLISKRETDDIIEACFRTGLKKPGDILKVVREYERVRSGQLLFDQFLSGNIGVYEFDADGCPVFEPVRDNTRRRVAMEASVTRPDESERAVELIGGRFVSCECDPGLDGFAFYRAVIDFCSRWGINILGGENPEEASVSSEDPDFVAECRRRSWVVSRLEATEDKTTIEIAFSGNWLRTSH